MTQRQKNNLARIILSAILLIFIWALPLNGYIQFIAFLIPYGIIGYDVLWSAIRNIFHGQIFDENFLMALATIGAFFIAEYPEAVAVMLFYQTGELFQGIAVGKSRKSIAALMDIRPDYATVIRQGKELRIAPDEVKIDETILVKPGEKIPLDGIICEGFASVNTSALTGESLPVDKTIGDFVISGSLNLNGVIQIKVRSTYKESTVSKILDLVENSSAKKAKTENFITHFARYYTPCVVIGAVLLVILPPLFFSQEWGEWFNRALIFLVVSCPCALVISVPLSFFGGIGSASRNGILIKGSNYLEALSKVNTIVFDKTGTLTKGTFEVTSVHPERISKEELLHIAAEAESYSNHPIGESIVRTYGQDIDKSRLSKIEEIPGMGIKIIIDGNTIYTGNDKLMNRIGVNWHPCHNVGTTVHIAMKDEYMGHIVISDQIKPDAKDTIKNLKALGIEKTVMLTGDMRIVGDSVGKELLLDEIYTNLLPDGKVLKIEDLLKQKKNKETLVFVGDGINDAPVLSRADVGLAMGALGSDAAIEASDIVIMDDKLPKIVTAIELSKKTMKIVHQNIILALSVKGLILILGAIGIANMWLAVFADVGVMIIAIINALRLLYQHKSSN